MTMTTEAELVDKAATEIAQDDDHIVATDPYDLAWLVAQLACYPTRVDQERTMNDRFLRLSAAATLLSQPERLSPSLKDADVEAVARAIDPYAFRDPTGDSYAEARICRAFEKARAAIAALPPSGATEVTEAMLEAGARAVEMDFKKGYIDNDDLRRIYLAMSGSGNVDKAKHK